MPVPPSPHRSPPSAPRSGALLAVMALVAPACDLIILPDDPPRRPAPHERRPVRHRPAHPRRGPDKPAIPEVGVLAGAYVHPRPEPVKAIEQALWSRREADAGRTYDIGHTFYSFTKDVPDLAGVVARVARAAPRWCRGGRPARRWSPTAPTTSSSAPGPAPSVTSTRRSSSAGWPRWTGTPKAPLAESPAKFTAAWRHMHDLFEQEGADNVAFVWCPNSWTYDVSPALASLWYPGGDTVDWVCADGYNWAPARSDPWTSFQSGVRGLLRLGGHDRQADHDRRVRCDRACARARRRRGSGPSARRCATSSPTVKAIVYFDEDKSEDGTHYDWRLDATPASYEAWNDLIRDPYLDTRRYAAQPPFRARAGAAPRRRS